MSNSYLKLYRNKIDRKRKVQRNPLLDKGFTSSTAEHL